jgi:hypothetical protein
MPDHVIDEVLENLPVQLIESVCVAEVESLITEYSNAGLHCIPVLLPICDYQIVINEISDLSAAREILKQFFKEEELPKSNNMWASPRPLKNLLARFVIAQLESQGIEAEYKQYNHGTV